MNSWQITRIDQCARIVGGSTPKTSVKDYWDGEIYWATPKDLSNLESPNLEGTPRKITKAGLNSCGAEVLPEGSVLFSSRAPIGHVAINCVPMATNQGFKSFVPDPEKLDSKFLYYWLRKNRAYFNSLGNGATFKEVSKAIVSRIEIPLPPIAEQKRIAAILDKAEELRGLRRQALGELDALTQSIFLETFGERRCIEEKWNFVEFGDVIEVLTDYHANGSYEILRNNVVLKNQLDYALMVRTTDLENNNFEDDCIYIAEKAYNFLSKSKIYGGEIIINKIGSAGKVYLMPSLGRPASLGMNAFLIRLSSQVSTLFVYHFLISPIGREAINRNVKGAVTKTITKQAIREISLPNPPLSLQQEFARRLEAIEQLKATHRESLAYLDALFASLQHRAFRGEL